MGKERGEGLLHPHGLGGTLGRSGDPLVACCPSPFTLPWGAVLPAALVSLGVRGVPAHLPHGDTPIFLSQEDVFIQQTQDTKNPIIYAVFSASG